MRGSHTWPCIGPNPPIWNISHDMTSVCFLMSCTTATKDPHHIAPPSGKKQGRPHTRAVQILTHNARCCSYECPGEQSTLGAPSQPDDTTIWKHEPQSSRPLACCEKPLPVRLGSR